jgi:EmrB/QacA subfamily drug resistance transporter
MTSTTAAAPAAGTAPEAEPPARTTPAGGLLTHRQTLTILAGLMAGMFLAALDQTIVATAIRTIGDDLHGLTVQAWVTTAYLITSTITTPLYGKLSDIYGRRPFFLLAISLFVLGSAASSFATSMYMLAAFRAFQGLGAGGLFSLALTILGDIVPPRQRAKYQGYFLAVFGTSSVLGPVIGGFFAGQSSILGITGWRWVFLVNVPVGFIAFAIVYRVLHLPHVSRPHRIDWMGALALVVGLVPLLTVAEQGRTWGWGSGRSLAGYAIGIAGLGLFVLAEHRMGDDALISLRFFRNQTFSLVVSINVLVGAAMFGAISMLPLYLQIVRGASPTKSGLLLLPLTLGLMIGSIVSGQIVSRTGRYKVFPVIGLGLLTVATALLVTVGADTSLVWTDILMFFFGYGLGNVMQPTVLAIQNSMEPRDIGVSTSSATFFRQIGATLGVAVFLSVLYSSVPGKLAEAFRAAAGTSSFQAAATNPAVLKVPANQELLGIARLATTGGAAGGSGGGTSSALDDTAFLKVADQRLAHPFYVGFSDSMHIVFVLGAGIVAVAFVLIWFLRELPLRTQSALEAQASLSEASRSESAAAPGMPVEDADAAAELSGAPVGPPDGAAVGNAADGVPAVTPRVRADSSGSAVTGRVLRGTGTPLAGATLTLTDLGGRQLDVARSDDAGSYRLGAPAGGTYLVVCAADGFQPLASTVVLSGAEVTHDLTLARASSLTGTVTGADGHALTGAGVAVTDVRGQVVAATRTGADGAYELRDLYAGDYTLAATATDHEPAARSVTVTDGLPSTCDLALLGVGSLSGTIRAASNGQPVGEATVTLIDATGVVVATVVTDATGTYTVPDLRTGEYTITATGYAPAVAGLRIGVGGLDGVDLALKNAARQAADEQVVGRHVARRPGPAA